MRKLAWLGICAAVFGVNVASADVVTVSMTAHVTRVNDPSLALPVGTSATATYSYDTLAAVNPDGTYAPVAPPAIISVTVAGQTYQSQGYWLFQITVTPSTPGSFGSSFGYMAGYSPGGTNTPAYLFLGFSDSSGGWPPSTALPTTAPNVNSNEPTLSGNISVTPPGSSGFTLAIDSATLVPSLSISPASSVFGAQQNFDAYVLLSSQIVITSMQASVGGTAIALNYPGTCQLAAANSVGRTALVCPNASAVLAGLGAGVTQVDWQVVLADGSTVQQSVLWNLIL